MDKTIRKFTKFDDMKAEEYRYWQSRPVWERLDAVAELNGMAYELKGWEMSVEHIGKLVRDATIFRASPGTPEFGRYSHTPVQ